MGYAFSSTFRVVKSSWLPAKISAYMFSISRLRCCAFLYGWHLLNKISLDWSLTLTTQLSTSKLSDNLDILTDFYRFTAMLFFVKQTLPSTRLTLAKPQNYHSNNRYGKNGPTYPIVIHCVWSSLW